MRRIKIMAIVSVCLILMVFAFDQVNFKETVYGRKEILPYPSTFTLEATIYYINDDALLESEQKKIVVKNNQLIEAIIAALKEPPTLKNCRQTISDDVRVLSAKIIRQKLYLNLNKAFVKSPYWEDEYRLLTIYSLINSITQFDIIDHVQLRIEGVDINKYTDDNSLNADFTFNDSVTYQKPDSPEEVVLSFLNFNSLNRYDLAYKMLSNPDDISKADFIAEMKIHKQAKKSYDITQPFSRRDGDLINVYVQYQYYDTIRNITYDGGTEIWQLREDGEENYSVIWPRIIK